MDSILGHLVDLRDLLGSHVLFSIGSMLVVGYVVGTLAGKVGLPEVTGFILAGVLLGNSLLGVVPRHMSDSMKVITEVALGLIALTIGSEFSLVKLRRMGRKLVGTTVGQLLVTFAVVTGHGCAAGRAAVRPHPRRRRRPLSSHSCSRFAPAARSSTTRTGLWRWKMPARWCSSG